MTSPTLSAPLCFISGLIVPIPSNKFQQSYLHFLGTKNSKSWRFLIIHKLCCMLQIIFFRIRYYSYPIQYPLSRQQILNVKKYTITQYHHIRRLDYRAFFNLASHNLIIILTAKPSGDTGICSWFMAFSNFSSHPGNETSCDHHSPRIRLRFLPLLSEWGPPEWTQQ